MQDSRGTRSAEEMRKTAEEITFMRDAQAITDAAFTHIVEFIQPYMTEKVIAAELERFMFECGAEELAFPSIVACGPNAVDPHAVPGERKFERGMCLELDFGAVKHGYCSDMTRMVFYGRPSDMLQRAYVALREANEAVEALLRPGVTGKEAHDLACRIMEDYGFGGCMPHALGHGVGREIHEDPVLAPRNDKPLCEGNVVTVEPGIYVEGESSPAMRHRFAKLGCPAPFGMRLEDCGVITADGFDVFTQSTHDMIIIG